MAQGGVFSFNPVGTHPRNTRVPKRPGVPLGQYRALGAGVRLSCRDCQLHADLPLEAVIARLEARGVGGAHTGVIELAGLVRVPARCGGWRFVTRPHFRAGRRRGSVWQRRHRGDGCGGHARWDLDRLSGGCPMEAGRD